MSALLTFLALVAANMTPVTHTCSDFEFESTDDAAMTADNLVCHSDGVTYDSDHYRLTYGTAEVWQ